MPYRRRHRYLTVVADHATGRIVWVAKGRNAATLQAFFDELGERKATIRAVSIDMSGGYEKAIRDNAPHAEIAFDPFHVVRVGADAVDQVRRDEWNAHERSHTTAGRWVKNTRWALLKAPDRQSLDQLGTLGEVYRRNQRLYRLPALPPAAPAPRAKIPRSRRRTSTPGSAGPLAPSSRRSSTPPAPCAATARRARRDPVRPVQRPRRRGPQQPVPAHQPPAASAFTPPPR